MKKIKGKMRKKSKVWLVDGIRKIIEVFVGLKFVENKIQVAFHILGLGKEKIIYYLKNELKLEISNKEKLDRTAILSINDIFGGKSYPVGKSKNRKVILDLGANIGVYSLYTALENPNAKIFAFEPDKNNFNQLVNNIKINNLEKRIFPYQEAIAKKSGELIFYRDKVSSRGHSLLRDSGDKIVVNAISLETVFSRLKIEKCDILKMDIEGAEYEVLYSCPQELFKRINTMIIECHDDFISINNTYTKTAMKRFLSRNGFNIVRDYGLMLTVRR